MFSIMFRSNADMPERRLSEHRLRESPFRVRESNEITFPLSQFLSSQEVLREEPGGYAECRWIICYFAGPAHSLVSQIISRISINFGICKLTDLLHSKFFGKLRFNVVNSTTNTLSKWRSN